MGDTIVYKCYITLLSKKGRIQSPMKCNKKVIESRILNDVMNFLKQKINEGVPKMPNIRPISDLRNNSNEISEFCKTTNEPVFITKNGVGDMVVLSIDMYERQEAQLELYAKLAEAEAEVSSGVGGADFFEFAKKLRVEAHA